MRQVCRRPPGAYIRAALSRDFPKTRFYCTESRGSCQGGTNVKAEIRGGRFSGRKRQSMGAGGLGEIPGLTGEAEGGSKICTAPFLTTRWQKMREAKTVSVWRTPRRKADGHLRLSRRSDHRHGDNTPIRRSNQRIGLPGVRLTALPSRSGRSGSFSPFLQYSQRFCKRLLKIPTEYGILILKG